MKLWEWMLALIGWAFFFTTFWFFYLMWGPIRYIGLGVWGYLLFAMCRAVWRGRPGYYED